MTYDTERPRPVDEDEGLAIPQSEEQARDDEVSPEVHDEADKAARDTEVEGSTEIEGSGGGARFWGADAPTEK